MYLKLIAVLYIWSELSFHRNLPINQFVEKLFNLNSWVAMKKSYYPNCNPRLNRIMIIFFFNIPKTYTIYVSEYKMSKDPFPFEKCISETHNFRNSLAVNALNITYPDEGFEQPKYVDSANSLTHY